MLDTHEVATVGGCFMEAAEGNGEKEDVGPGEEEGEREEERSSVDENGDDAALCGEDVRTDRSLQSASRGRRREMSGRSGQSGGEREGRFFLFVPVLLCELIVQ